MTHPKPQSKPKVVEEKNLLHRLSAGLSEKEIQRVLAKALAGLGPTGLERLVKKLGLETGAALRRTLKAPGGKHRLEPSFAKVREEWKRVWKDWDDCIAEACDEKGRYVIQEREWEQPYFDPLSVTDELEPIAARMRKILPQVFEKKIDPDFSFAQAVRESVKEIASNLPDWMDPFADEGFALGPQATGCLLDWEWRTARTKGITAFSYVDQLCELEMATEGLCLDEQVIARFIRKLDALAKKDIFLGIQRNRGQDRWKQVLDSAHSGWCRIYKELCRAQDRPALERK